MQFFEKFKFEVEYSNESSISDFSNYINKLHGNLVVLLDRDDGFPSLCPFANIHAR